MTPGDDGAPDPAAARAALRLVEAVARRAAIAEHLESSAGEAVLRSVVEAAVALIRAEAASIALHDPQADRLVFRVAAGEQGQGVVGLSIATDQGIAGHVFSTGQPLALGEATADPRFGRAAAEQTGYVPRSLVAVPLADDEGTIGVLEVLDRRDGQPFDLADLDAAAVFARQATVAIRATRLERDTARLLGTAIRSLDGSLDAAEVDALIAEVTSALDDESALWRLADAVARARDADPGQVELVAEILEALARRTGRAANSRYRGGRRR